MASIWNHTMVKFLDLLIRLFGGKIAGAVAAWLVTMTTLGVVQIIGYLGTHGLGWLVGGWNAQTVVHVILVSFVGATINHLGNLASANGNPIGGVLTGVAGDIAKSPGAVLRAEPVTRPGGGS